MRAALYIRVSTDEQARDGFSIDAQKTLLIKKAEEFHYSITDYYIDDGYSAKDMKRPALKRLIEDVKEKKVDVVLFWRLDRFTRRSQDFHKMNETFTKHGAGIKSATEPVDTTTAIGRFQLELSVLLGQLERETTAERVHFVMEDRHMKGLRNGAEPPFGYDLIDGKLIPNPAHKEVVMRIFDLYKKNMGCLAIAKLFNREGVPYKEKWSYSTVYYIINNPVYCGKLRWNYRKLGGERTGKEIIVDSDHEPFITVEEFEYLHKLRERRRRIKRAATSDYPFTGILRCGRCGYTMIGHSRRNKNSTRRSYRCVGRFGYGVCDMPIISEDRLTRTFFEKLDAPQTELDKMVVSSQEDDRSHEVFEQLRKELEEIQKQKKRLQQGYLSGLFSAEDVRDNLEEFRKKEEYLTAQLEAAPTKEKSQWTYEEIVHQLREIKNYWDQIEDNSAKKNFLNDVFEHITINTDVQEAKGGPGYSVPIYIVGWDFKTM